MPAFQCIPGQQTPQGAGTPKNQNPELEQPLLDSKAQQRLLLSRNDCKLKQNFIRFHRSLNGTHQNDSQKLFNLCPSLVALARYRLDGEQQRQGLEPPAARVEAHML
jgi:hypothetical protein